MKSCLLKVSFSEIAFPVLYKKHKWELWWSKQVWNQVKFQLMTLTCVHCRQPGWDVPASDWRQGADGERAQGGRHELHRVEVPHRWGSPGGQSGHGYKASWAEQWVVWTLPVFCLRDSQRRKVKSFWGLHSWTGSAAYAAWVAKQFWHSKLVCSLLWIHP